MGFLDKLFGRDEATGDAPPPARSTPGRSSSAAPQSADEQAVARYLYLLKTAPPEEIEKAHEEAFAKLSLEQRRQVLQQLGQVVPHSEYSRLRDDPACLARAATRAEMQQPGTLRQAFGGGGMGGGMQMPGMGMMMMGGLMTSLAGAFIGTAIAQSFFNNPTNEAGFQDSPEAGGDASGEGADNGADGDASGDAGASEAGSDQSYDASADGAEAGFDSGFDGGDFGGGDFGGGDFGGGDF